MSAPTPIPKRLMVPTVHLNGTSRDELLRQLTEAWNAIEAAIHALREAAPHGRDYYPQDPPGSDPLGPSWRKAIADHEVRLRMLENAREELRQIAERIV